MNKKGIVYIVGGIFLAGISLFLLSHIHRSEYIPISVIIPHFTILPQKLDTIRSKLAQGIGTSEPTIIIISPDHFATYRTNNLVYDDTITSVCVQGYCQGSQGAWIAPLSSSYTINNHTLILPDHGIGAHFRFIKKWLPQAKVIPLLLQPRSIDNLAILKKQIENITSHQPTIIIGSVDRSHYVPEPWAKLHDDRTRSIIASDEGNRNNRKALDVDCPSCLRLVNDVARNNQQSPELLRRDSSANLFGSTDLDNTSRAAIWYRGDHDKELILESGLDRESLLETGVTLLMVGGIMYDRGVSQALPTMKDLSQYFSNRYELHDTTKNPLSSFHRLGASIDLTILNLETPLYASGSTCYPIEKEYGFCSHEMILDALSDIGFNTISFANDHVYNAGNKQYNITKDIIKKHGIEVISSDDIVKKTIRGIQIALHAYDFTVLDKDEIIDRACGDTQQSIQEGYKPIISVHRGEEYAKQPSNEQKTIAQKLITCGAKAIIGHHPHAVQPIEWIHNVPVIYSLGDSLTEHSIIGGSGQGLLVGMLIPWSGEVKVFTGDI